MPKRLQVISPIQPDPSLPIKEALLRRKMTVTALAIKVRRSRVATSRAIHHPTRLPKLRARIEEVLNA